MEGLERKDGIAHNHMGYGMNAKETGEEREVEERARTRGWNTQ